MYRNLLRTACGFAAAAALAVYGCGNKTPELKDLPDLNEQTKPYVTTENTKLRTGPGPRFRAITDINRDARVNVVGRDGEWVLIVSKKGNAPGYIEMASIKPAVGDVKDVKDEAAAPQVEGRYQAVADTEVRSGPGLHYPVVAKIGKGTKLTVVEEDKGWLKVESKRGNKPGYVDATLTKPATE
jgi:uncharacterized protein YgiM (DUF1202 family)